MGWTFVARDLSLASAGLVPRLAGGLSSPSSPSHRTDELHLGSTGALTWL